MVKTVIGSFDSYDEAQRVVSDLKDEGFMDSDISIVASNATGAYAADTALDASGNTVATGRLDTTGTTVVDRDTSGAATGAVTGGVVGGAAGLAISLMGLAIPGIGPIIAAGPIVAALTGAGVGAVAGGLIGGLTDLGVTEADAQYYAEAVRRGGALVTVRADETRAERAADLMRKHGAVDIERRAETWRQSGWSGYDAKAEPYTTGEVERERATWRASPVSATGTRTYGYAGTGTGAGSTAGGTGESSLDVSSRTGATAATSVGAGNYAGSGMDTASAGTGGAAGMARTGSGSYAGAGDYTGTGATGDRPRTSAEWDTYERDFRSDYESNYAGRGGSFDDYAPAYRHGLDSARQYRGRRWDEVEPELQRDWERNNPGREWARFKSAAQRGWQRMSDAIERAVPGDSDRDGK